MIGDILIGKKLVKANLDRTFKFTETGHSARIHLEFVTYHVREPRRLWNNPLEYSNPREVVISIVSDMNYQGTWSGGQSIGRFWEMLDIEYPYLEYDELPQDMQYLHDVLVFWDKYHLNDVHAGTEEQEECIALSGYYEYRDRVEHLKAKGLYEHLGYKYGHGFIYKRVPKEALENVLTSLEKLGARITYKDVEDDRVITRCDV